MTMPTIIYYSTGVHTLDRRVHGSISIVSENERDCRTGLSVVCTNALELRSQDSGLWDISTTVGVSRDSAGQSSLAVFVVVVVICLSVQPKHGVVA